MMQTTLILAAHGDGDESESNTRVRAIASEIHRDGMFSQVLSTFNKGTPSFENVLREVNTSHVVVVPLMTSDGYFANDVLPQRLYAGQPEAQPTEVTITPPIGVATEIELMLIDAVHEVLAEFSLDASATDVLVVGHGTTRNANSSQRTNAIANALADATPVRNVFTAFLDEPPSIKSVLSNTRNGDLVVVPFLFGGGGHVLHDIPKALGMQPQLRGYFEPVLLRRDDGMTILLPPLGWMPGIVDVIRSVAGKAVTDLEAARV